MTPVHPPPDLEFRANIELVLLVLGIVMTIGVACVAVWLVKTMRREDREQANDAANGRDGGEA
ncbi:MAG: hypothetical protein SGJ09_09895 [Phycisphaerae bacterium]|nr:hypothetical protein [Phycisphaerae bacterium]